VERIPFWCGNNEHAIASLWDEHLQLVVWNLGGLQSFSWWHFIILNVFFFLTMKFQIWSYVRGIEIVPGLMRTHGLRGSSKRRKCSVCRQRTGLQCNLQRTCTWRKWRRSEKGKKNEARDLMRGLKRRFWNRIIACLSAVGFFQKIYIKKLFYYF
jgi:hypothetical protein